MSVHVAMAAGRRCIVQIGRPYSSRGRRCSRVSAHPAESCSRLHHQSGRGAAPSADPAVRGDRTLQCGVPPVPPTLRPMHRPRGPSCRRKRQYAAHNVTELVAAACADAGCRDCEDAWNMPLELFDDTDWESRTPGEWAPQTPGMRLQGWVRWMDRRAGEQLPTPLMFVAWRRTDGTRAS
jgi:hypothetical protein